MKITELRYIAKEQLNPMRLSPFASAGSVAAAIQTAAGNIYTGVCIDTPAGMGFCAEHSAAAAMINAGESQIKKLAVVGIEDKIACAPCGRCREFLCALDLENYKCEVLLENGEVTTLGELLPYRFKEISISSNSFHSGQQFQAGEKSDMKKDYELKGDILRD